MVKDSQRYSSTGGWGQGFGLAAAASARRGAPVSSGEVFHGAAAASARRRPLPPSSPHAAYPILHFIYTPFDASIIPPWIPWHFFWTYFTALTILAAGIAILLNKAAHPATILLGDSSPGIGRGNSVFRFAHLGSDLRWPPGGTGRELVERHRNRRRRMGSLRRDYRSPSCCASRAASSNAFIAIRYGPGP